MVRAQCCLTITVQDSQLKQLLIFPSVQSPFSLQDHTTRLQKEALPSDCWTIIVLDDRLMPLSLEGLYVDLFSYFEIVLCLPHDCSFFVLPLVFWYFVVCNIKFFTACSHLAALFFYFFSLSLSLSVSLWSNREIAIKWGPCLNKVKKQRKEGVILSNVMSHSWPVYCPMKKHPQINSRINRCFPGVEDFVAHLEKIDCSVLWWWAFKLYHTFLATPIS